MKRINSITTLSAILVAIIYAITHELFWLFITIHIINFVISFTNYIRVFGFDCTEWISWGFLVANNLNNKDMKQKNVIEILKSYGSRFSIYSSHIIWLEDSNMGNEFMKFSNLLLKNGVGIHAGFDVIVIETTLWNIYLNYLERLQLLQPFFIWYSACFQLLLR